jgi:hypothetical protein
MCRSRTTGVGTAKVLLSVSNVRPIVVSILVGDSLIVPDHLSGIHRGEMSLSPIICRGFIGGECPPRSRSL